jgi:hypothetical protein
VKPVQLHDRYIAEEPKEGRAEKKVGKPKGRQR